MTLSFKLEYTLIELKKYLEKIEGLSNLKEILNTLLDKSISEEVFAKTIARLQPLIDSKGTEKAEAAYLLGCYYRDTAGTERHEKLGFELITFSAEQGFSLAQNSLGFHYNLGNGFPKAEERAFYFYTLAANQGLPTALCNLAYLYEKGHGVPKDSKRALELYTLAAINGDANDQYNLGLCYQSGLGISKDKGRAVLLFQAAAEKGKWEAQEALRKILANGTHKYIPTLAKAVSHYNDLKDKDLFALSTLAFCYQMGLGTEPNFDKALEYYRSIDLKHFRRFMRPKIIYLRQWNIYLCHLMQHQQGKDLKFLGEFYEKIDSIRQEGDNNTNLLFAYLHEYSAPGLPNRSLYTAQHCYEVFRDAKSKSKSKEDGDLKEITEIMKEDEIEFEIEIDSGVNVDKYVKDKLEHFEILPKLKEAIQEFIPVIPIAKLVSEYAFR